MKTIRDVAFICLFFLLSPITFLEAQANLPQWLESTRVHAHTRMRWSAGSGPTRPEFVNLADNFNALGVKVFTQHVKSNPPEGATWCSTVGKIEPAIDVTCNTANPTDLPRGMIDRAQNNGQEVFLYYKHYFDDFWRDANSSWISVDALGVPIQASPSNADPDDYYLSVNSPFRDVLITRIEELVAKGAGGIYFDFNHSPFNGCWSPDSQSEYLIWSNGTPMPLVTDYLNDPEMPNIVNFNNYAVEQHFTEITDAMHLVDPDAIALVSVSLLPGLIFDRLSTKLAAIADVPKTEYSLPIRRNVNRHFIASGALSNYFIPDDLRLAVGWDVVRGASKHKLHHSWFFTDELVEEAPDRVKALVGSAYTHNFILNLDHIEASIPDQNLYDNVYVMDQVIGPEFVEKRPVQWTAILFSEHARNLRVQDYL
ncbi:MAG: hypothetical protein AAFP19_24470, partial [Bacteroidota bacterium]